MKELTQEDIKHIEKMYEARQKGLYYDSKLVTDIYNKIFDVAVAPTNCGSCIRRRVDAIWGEYNKIKDLTSINNAKTETKREGLEQDNQKELKV